MPDHLEPLTTGVVEGASSARLIVELKAAGDDVFAVPLPAFEAREPDATELSTLAGVDGFDLVVVADVVAADVFPDWLAAAGMDAFALDSATVVAVGEAVADGLKFSQIHADVIPSRTARDEVFAAASSYLGGFSGCRVLIVGEWPSEAYVWAGAEVAKLSVYAPPAEANARVRSLVLGGTADRWVFTHPAEIHALRLLTGVDSLSAVLGGVPVLATSELVFQTLQEHGLRPLYYKA